MLLPPHFNLTLHTRRAEFQGPGALQSYFRPPPSAWKLVDAVAIDFTAALLAPDSFRIEMLIDSHQAIPTS